VPLAKSLHRAIINLGKRLEKAAIAEENSRTKRWSALRTAGERDAELRVVVQDIQALLKRMDSDIHYLHVALTSAGESLTSTAPGISPSRLMQASALLVWGNSQFAFEPDVPAQIGPCFHLSLYMLFLGHATQGKEPYGLGDGERKPLWQEVMHKARVRLVRTPIHWKFDQEQGYCPESLCGDTSGVRRDQYYHYELELVEDINDGRVHDDGVGVKSPGPFDEVLLAGIRESIPVHQVSKLFYTNTGRILNIGDSSEVDNNPVLLMKRDCSAAPPARLNEEYFNEDSSSTPEVIRGGSEGASDTASSGDQADVERQIREESEAPGQNGKPAKDLHRWRFPKHLDPEWLALEVFAEDNDEDDSEEADSDSDMDRSLLVAKRRTTKVVSAKNRRSVDSRLVEQIRRISFQSRTEVEGTERTEEVDDDNRIVDRSPLGAITSSLSLLEMLIRLMHVQMVRQTTHLAVPDHITAFFLEETSTTGLQGEAQWKAREAAKQHVGFDPYADTPDTPQK
jgi:hypothetical protein